MKERGLKGAPRLAIGNGALGFWGAIREVYPKTKHQRCWVHKTANILDKLPKSIHAKAKEMIHNIYLAETKKDAEKAWKKFVRSYRAKYPKAVECLVKDKDELMEFYNFPAEHWIHLRTTNPIESTFATVKHRTRKSKNCFSRKTLISSTFKLFMEAEKRWRKLSGSKRITQVINMEKFIDGTHENELDYTVKEEQNYAA
jgi:transposase-like protein